MAGTTRAIGAGAVIAAAILSSDRAAARQEPELTNADRPVASEVPRVRTDHPVLATLIREGLDRSTTFRRLVDAIQITDGMATLGTGDVDMASVCASPSRLLSPAPTDYPRGRRRLVPEAEAITAIAHELYHALEILGQPGITTMEAIYFFYKQHGSWRGDVFETDAAVDAGNAVYRELRKRTRTGN